MYNEAFLRNIIKMKLQTMDIMIRLLPKDLQDSTKSIKDDMIKAIHDSTGEYMKDNNHKKNSEKLKPIQID